MTLAIAGELLAAEAARLRDAPDPERTNAVNAERRLLATTYTDAGPTSLGHARTFTLDDLRVEIGIHRVNPFFRGSDYWRPPRGYMTVKTSARGKVRADTPLQADSLRALGAALLGYADTLDAWQAAEANQPEAVAS